MLFVRLPAQVRSWRQLSPHIPVFPDYYYTKHQLKRYDTPPTIEKPTHQRNSHKVAFIRADERALIRGGE
jgi:hypothetical protein